MEKEELKLAINEVLDEREAKENKLSLPGKICVGILFTGACVMLVVVVYTMVNELISYFA